MAGSAATTALPTARDKLARLAGIRGRNRRNRSGISAAGTALLKRYFEARRSRKFSGSPNARSIFHTDNARGKLGAAPATEATIKAASGKP